ncbi:MAG TPA: winged helix-turn-helix domain-containing protein [Candidatus Acidoferrum sp.]|nr:winged helix-turn-helix domain-containing protein [Candidatus Acidoferrum sp.]
MASNVTKPIAYRFGSFEFDPQTGELRRQGLRIRLEGQPVAILAMLLERPNQLVTREELQKRLWPGDTFVDFEQSLNAAVRRLRLALDDSAESPRYIETLARKGYRWVAPLRGRIDAVKIEENYAVTVSEIERRPRGPKVARIAIVGGVALAILVGAWSVFRSRPATGRVMLAVLPFQNLGNDPQQEILADGMTEEMITQLGGLNPEQLGVIARTSASQYKTRNKNAAQIARELNVKYLLEGSVRRDGQHIRVTAQLIQASDQADVWAGSYDSDIGDILKVQSEVARAIAGQIRVQLTRQTEQRLSNTPRVNASAHDAYLQGQQSWDLRDKEGTARSIEQFQHAIEIDPSYATAYAALARAYALSPVSGFMTAAEAMPKARDTAARTIALDDSLAEGHSIMGFIKAHYEYDWPAAEREFQEALRLNPSDSLAHLFYSNSYLSPLGRHNEAIAEMKTAIALDPFSLRIQSFLGRTYVWARRYDDALVQLQKVTQMFPNLAIEHERLAHLYTYRGEYDKAIAEESRARIIAGENPGSVLRLEQSLRSSFAARGPRGYWEKMLELSHRSDNPPEAYTTHDGLAIIYVRLGDKDKALQALEQAYKERQLHMTEIGIEPAFDALRSEPRFQKLLDRIGVRLR